MSAIQSSCKYFLDNLNTNLPVLFIRSVLNIKYRLLSYETLKNLGLSSDTIENYATSLKNPLNQRQVETITILVSAFRKKLEVAAHPAFKKVIEAENLPSIKQMTDNLIRAGFDSTKFFEEATLATAPEKIKDAKTTVYKAALLARFQIFVKEDDLDEAVDIFKTLAPQFTDYPLSLLIEYREQVAKDDNRFFCDSVKKKLLISFLMNRLNQAKDENNQEAFLKNIQLAAKLRLLNQCYLSSRFHPIFHAIKNCFTDLKDSGQLSSVSNHLCKNLTIPQEIPECLEDYINVVADKIPGDEVTIRFNRMWCEISCIWDRQLQKLSLDLQKKVINSVLELSRMERKWTGLLSLYAMDKSHDFKTHHEAYLAKIQTSLKEGTFDDVFFHTLIEIRGVFNAYRLLHEAHEANGKQGGPLTETLFDFFSKSSELSWEMTYSYAYGLAQLETDATPRYLNKNEQRPLSIFIANKNSFAVPPPQISNKGCYKKQRWAVFLCKEEIPEASAENNTRAFLTTITKVALCNFISGRKIYEKELEALQAVQPYPNFVKLIASVIHNKESNPWEKYEKPVFLCTLFEGDLEADTVPANTNIQHPRRPLTIDLLIKYIQDIADGTAVMHDKLELFHRDFKAANIFFAGENIGIGDFGLSKKASEPHESWYGSPKYSAPELFLEGPHQTTPLDMYALGLLINELMTKDETLSWENELTTIYSSQKKDPQLVTQVIDKMKSFADELQNWPGTIVTDQLKRIVGQLLEVDPTKRMTASQLSKAIKEISRNLTPDVAAEIV